MKSCSCPIPVTLANSLEITQNFASFSLKIMKSKDNCHSPNSRFTRMLRLEITSTLYSTIIHLNLQKKKLLTFRNKAVAIWDCFINQSFYNFKCQNHCIIKILPNCIFAEIAKISSNCKQAADDTNLLPLFFSLSFLLWIQQTVID